MHFGEQSVTEYELFMIKKLDVASNDVSTSSNINDRSTWPRSILYSVEFRCSTENTVTNVS